jgi:RNase P/RNase MRP subunit p30
MQFFKYLQLFWLYADSDMQKKTDFFVPKGNEDELMLEATRLGVVPTFLYRLSEFPKNIRQNTQANQQDMQNNSQKSTQQSNQKNIQMNVQRGILLDSNVSIKDLSRAKQICDVVVVKAGDNLRELMESAGNFFIYGLENSNQADRIHQRDSGFNHILAEMASKKKITLLFNVSALIASRQFEQARMLGRLRQNMMLCTKFKCTISAATFASDKHMIKPDADVLLKLVTSSNL